ncbi:MAG: hypothetical protein WDO13_07600 [Verrucomicrobiota bacterium]
MEERFRVPLIEREQQALRAHARGASFSTRPARKSCSSLTRCNTSFRRCAMSSPAPSG